MQAFGENLRRLLGVHDLRAREAARLIGVSPQSLSEWMRGHRQPNLQMLLRVASFLEINGERLVRVPFRELLRYELADQRRFDKVETKIRRQRETTRRTA